MAKRQGQDLMGSLGPPLEGLVGAGIWKGQKACGSWAYSVDAASLTCAPREVMKITCSLLSGSQSLLRG